MVPLPAWLNPFDVLIAVALIGGVIWGFLRGLVRMVLSLASLYVATVLAMSFYVPLGERVAYLSANRLSTSTNEAIAFLFILVVVSVILNFGLKKAFRQTELPGVRQIDQLGGLVMGFVLVAMWIGLLLVGLAFVLRTPGAGSDAFRLNVLNYFHASRLVPIFYRFLPLALATLRPWLPKGQLPAIFTFRLF